jgi:DNA invertase Pin-like site-specific DNA recombinase
VTTIGYVRLNTTKPGVPSSAIANAFLRGLGADRVFLDECGPDAPRPALSEALNTVRMGDTLLVPTLAVFGRSHDWMLHMLVSLCEQGVTLRVADLGEPSLQLQKWATGMLTAGAQIREERTSAGNGADEAPELARVRLLGRPRRMNEARIADAESMIRAGVTVTDVAKALGVSRATLHRYVDVAACRP